MLLRWQANGQLKLEFAERLFQYSQNTSHLYVLTDVFSSSEGQMFCQFGKWDASTAQYISLSDENGTPKIFSMGWKLQEKSDGSAHDWMYDCYIPAELLTHSGAVCVTLTYQLNGQSGNHDKPMALFTTGNFGFNIERNLPTGQIIPSDSELASLIDKVNELELNAMTAANTNVFAQTLPPESNATVSITITVDGTGQKHFTFNFGIPQGLKGDSGINSAYLSNDDGDSEENGYTQWKVNRLLESMLSNDDGDSATKGYTQSAANRIVNSKIVNAAGNSETKAYSQAAANNTFSNPNLLINPDFRINQRGRQEYGENVYSVDRWATGANTKLFVNSNGGITINSISSSVSYIMQRIEDTNALWGKDLTLSCELDNGANIQTSGTLPNVAPTTSQELIVSEMVNGVSLRLFFSQTTGIIDFNITANAGTVATIKFVKLEIGLVATPFITPLISEELVKSQRYYYRLFPSNEVIFIGTGSFALNISNKTCIVPITLPVTMRIAPTVTYTIVLSNGASALCRIEYSSLNYDHAEMDAARGNLWFIAETYQAPTGQAGDVFANYITSGEISFDAEIY